MYIGKKIMLLPTPEQEILFRKSSGVARWAYNFFLSENERIYNEYISNNKTGKKHADEKEVRKYINNTLKPTTHTWLKEVGSNVMKQGVKDASNALKNYLKGTHNFPKYKTKHNNVFNFYVNYESLKKTQNGFHGEKIGNVKTAEPLPDIKDGGKYLDPRISFDGKYWYLNVSYEIECFNPEKTGESLGIDLGIKNLATCSNKTVYKNINKTKEVQRLEKKIKRKQRRLSRKYQNNIIGHDSNGCIYKKPLEESKNFQKQKKEIKLLYRRLTNIRHNYIHQTTAEIVKTKPSRIVVEDLNVLGMLKNRHLSKAVRDQEFYEFLRQIEYKSQKYSIEFIKADRFFPSSKMCSCCGSIKKDLHLYDRTYKCDVCGLIIDRDYNASLNLANIR